MSELVKRLRSAEDSVGLTLYEEAADALEAQAKRIAELEASLADSNEAVQVMGLKLEQAEADIARLRADAGRLAYDTLEQMQQTLEDNYA